MTITPPSADALEYLESLMRAGRDAMKQFDDALASVAGVRDKEANSLGPLSPIGLVADLQRPPGRSRSSHLFALSPDLGQTTLAKRLIYQQPALRPGR